MWRICVALIFMIWKTLLSAIQQTEILLQENLKIEILQQEFFSSNFSTPDLLKLNDNLASKAIEYDGEHTRNSLNKLFTKAFNGKNISVLVLGGSSTQGADLGFQNRISTFHFGLKSWWEGVVTPITGSYMNRRVIGIGGIGTTYMGLCWKEYIRDMETIDLVIWEFFINDPDSSNYLEGVKRLFNSVSNHPSDPSVILARFFKPNIMKCLSDNVVCDVNICKIHSMKSSVLTQLTGSYRFTMINLLASTCAYLKAPSSSLKINEVFISHHPSHLAHAQMAYILINYVRNHFLKFLQNLENDIKNHSDISNKNIQEKQKETNTICWTGVLPSGKFIIQNNIFKLPVRQNYGFEKLKHTPWIPSAAVRDDVRGGYDSNMANTRIILTIPSTASQQYTVYVAISHKVDGGKTEIRLQSTNQYEILEIDCSRRIHAGMDINHIADHVIGDAVLQMDVLDGIGCSLNAIILEYEDQQFPLYTGNLYNQSLGDFTHNEML